MKVYFSLLLLFFISCNAVKKTEKPNITKTKITSQCPKWGTCTLSVLQNQSFDIRVDEIGMKSPVFKDKPGTSIIKFRYHHEAPAGIMDGNYTEAVYLEIKNKVDQLELKNESLQQVKLLYGRFCYCKGNVGYFEVNNGSLKLHREADGTATFSLVFNIPQVPQEIKEIKGTVVFK